MMLEAFLWALDTMNQNSQVLKGLKLGAFVTDTCRSPGETFSNLKNLFTKPGYYRNKNSSSDVLVWESVLGFINAPQNEPAIAAAEVFNAYKLTNIGPHSPTEILANKEKYPYTLQTSIPTDIQIKGLVNTLKRMNFSYVSVIHAQSRHGMAELRSFEKTAISEGICLALSESMPSKMEVPRGKIQLDQLILKLKTKKMQGARAVILLLSEPEEIKQFLEGLSRAEKNGLVNPGDFSLFGSVGWGDNMEAINSVEETSLGAMTLQYDINVLKPFKKFLEALKFENNVQNPWWRDYWMQKFGCNSSEECTKFQLKTDDIYLSPILSNIINGVWSLAVGLANLQQDVCKTEEGFCNALKTRSGLRDLIFRSVRQVAFSRADNPKETFKFGPAGHPKNMELRILNIVREKGQNGKVSYRTVGSIHDNGTVKMSLVPMAFENGHPVQMRTLTSECSNISICFECAKLASIAEKSLKLIPETTVKSTTTTTTTIAMSPSPSTAPSSIFTIPANPVTTQVILEAKYEEKFRMSKISDQSFLIAAVVPLHHKGSEPFSCGKMRDDSFQNLEALSWSLNQINQDPTLLPGVDLGLLTLDSCSQPSRAVRDLSNFLSGQIKFGHSNGTFINPEQTVGLVASRNNEEALALSRVSSQFDIPTVSPGAEAEMKESGFQTNLMRSSISNGVQADALASLLDRMKWDSVVFLYTNDVWGINGKENFETMAIEKGICIALSASLPITNCSQDFQSYDRIVDRLIALRQAGVYGVVLWTTPSDMKCLLTSVERATRAGSLKRGDLVWFLPLLSENIDEMLEGQEVNGVGMISLKPRAAAVAGFMRHWKNLNPSPEDQWRIEYFENTFGCHGVNCLSRKYSLRSKRYSENPFLLNTVNSILSLAHGIENIRRTICGAQTVGICARMKAHPNIQKVIAGAVKEVQFVDHSGKMFEFTPEGFSNTAMEIQNLQRNINGFEYRVVGLYNSSDGLDMRIAPKGFENGLQSFNLKDRVSTCRDFAVCPVCQKYENSQSTTTEKIFDMTTTEIYNSVEIDNRISHRQPDPSLTSNVQIPVKAAEVKVGSYRAVQDSIILPSSKKFSIAGVFPIHKSDDSVGLICGDFVPSSGFQKLAAFFYAIEEVNRNPHILPGIQLGAVALDSCSSEERALSNLFEIFASQTSGITTEEIFSLVGLDGEHAMDLRHMTKSMSMPLVGSTPTPLSLKAEDAVMGTVPAVDVHIRIMAEAIYQMEWMYVSVLFEESETYSPSAIYLESLLSSKGICIAKMANISSDGQLEDMQLIVRQLVMKTGSNAVILFLSDQKIRLLLKALAIERVSPARFIFVTTFNEDWTFDIEFLTLLSRFDQGLLTVEVQRVNNTNFMQYLSGLTPQRHQPFPDEWFYEFWQHTFQCFIPGAERSRSDIFNVPCSGNEKLSPSSFQQSPSILPTILAVQTAARGLHQFVQENCPGRSVNALSECLVSDPKIYLMRSMKTVNFSYAYSPEKDPVWVNFDSEGFMTAEYSIRNMLRRPDGNYQYQEVGVWRPQTGLLLDTNQIKVLGSHGESKIPSSRCPGEVCMECPNVTMMETSARPSLAERFDTVWGVIVASLAGLGIIVCLICILYFSITFPSNYGTTICGYVLLFGLMLVYATSFFFVMNPSALTCTMRRIATGISWAFVFAPMLVKVIHCWHMKAYEVNLVGTNAHQTSPFSLFCLCVGVAGVQIVIGIEWLILDSPTNLVFVFKYGGAVLTPGLWRCAPGGNFELQLTVSMVYVIFLIFLTTVFSLLTWHTDVHNRESRWVFMACVFTTVIWISWWCLVTQTTYSIRDPTAAIACVANATVILMCLYMRKAYLYQKYREEAKDFMDPSTVYQSSTVNSHFMLNGNMYGGKMMVGQGQPLFVHALPALAGSDGVLEPQQLGNPTGPVLYQNAAYDGGSEFNPGGSTLGVPNGASGNGGIIIVDGGDGLGNEHSYSAENGAIEESHRF